MGLGFDTVKDTFEVLVVPVAVAVLAVLWPAITASHKRRHFKMLIREELAEAVPRTEGVDRGAAWHAYLSKRFLHEEIIAHPVENTDFVLSLKPELAYHLSQLWLEFGKAREADSASAENAVQFHRHLGEATRLVEPWYRSTLETGTWQRWDTLLRDQHPDAQFHPKKPRSCLTRICTPRPSKDPR